MQMHCVVLVTNIGAWFVQFANSPFDLSNSLFTDLLHLLPCNHSATFDHVLSEL